MDTVTESGRANGTRRRESSAASKPSKNEDPKPWRTEGLPNQNEHDGANRPRPRWWIVLMYLGLGYLAVFGMLSFQDSLGGPVTVPYTEFTTQVEQRNVAEVFSQGESIQGTLREAKPIPGQDDSTKTYEQFTTERPTYAQDDLLTQLEQGGATVSAEPLSTDRGIFWNLLLSFAPILLLFGFWFWLFRRAQKMGPGGGGLFGVNSRKREPVDPETVRATFDDVAGIDEVKAEINEIVDYLRHPEKYRKLGAKVPKGVLLTGPPGTGKTLLARATAGEANVPFFSASGAEFIEMIVGVGASRVRELFEEARKVAPSIIFIDEIDTIGRSRGGGATVGGHDEREQTLNQILTEMDGFSGSEGVVVLAATNRPDVLDPALLRPGRFDRTVTVNPPDRKGRVAILRVHTRSVPLADDVDLDKVAAATPGMTGADLANLVNEAALAAARDGLTHVTDRYLSDALEKVQLGTARNVVVSEEERRRTAYHEAGHALLGMLQPGADPVRKVSIIPRGHALGVTWSTPEEDRYGYTADYLRGRIIGALGGMAAEEEIFGVVTTGSESDLETATTVARSMVGRWGMSERIGPVSVLPREGDPRMGGVSDSMLGAVDQEIRRLIDECYVEARRLLRDNRRRLEGIVAELLAHETLDESQVYEAAGISRAATATV
ncbi:protein FtsH [Mycolicibacterium novocastrense]|uniref:ATP-dependent zinc metalloprotease FtsH n=1 Tax=Mycolicibacterium novocastrense TaxID=59813 RepID=A0ABQ0KT54_MYCNV|nr:protein FtsH [Mycolicibacterium novocastrense]